MYSTVQPQHHAAGKAVAGRGTTDRGACGHRAANTHSCSHHHPPPPHSPAKHQQKSRVANMVFDSLAAKSYIAHRASGNTCTHHMTVHAHPQPWEQHLLYHCMMQRLYIVADTATRLRDRSPNRGDFIIIALFNLHPAGGRGWYRHHHHLAGAHVCPTSRSRQQQKVLRDGVEGLLWMLPSDS